MKSKLLVQPIDFYGCVPKDQILFDAAQKFCEEQFGKRLNFAGIKTWAVVKASDEDREVVGLSTVAYAIDCPLFHVKPAGEDDASREEARAVRDLLMTRAAGFIQDNAGVGTEVMVYVAPDQERFWKGYLRLIGAKPSNRHILKV